MCHSLCPPDNSVKSKQNEGTDTIFGPTLFRWPDYTGGT